MLFAMEPWGDERMEYLHGINTAVLANRGKRPISYMPFVKARQPAMDEDQMKSVVANICKGLGNGQ